MKMLNIDLQQMLQEYPDYTEVVFDNGIDPRFITQVSKERKLGLTPIKDEVIVLRGKRPSNYGYDLTKE